MIKKIAAPALLLAWAAVFLWADGPDLHSAASYSLAASAPKSVPAASGESADMTNVDPETNGARTHEARLDQKIGEWTALLSREEGFDGWADAAGNDFRSDRARTAGS